MALPNLPATPVVKSSALQTPHGYCKRTAWEVQRAVLFALVLREMKQRVGGQWVGAIWTVFEPLAHTMVLVTILGVMRGRVMPGIEYPVFLVTGLIPYFFFQHLTMRLMDAITANRGIFAYRQVKPIDALLSRAVVEALMNLIVYLLTLGILAWLGFHVLPAYPLELIGVHLLIGYLGLSMGILAAVVSHARPRVKSFIRVSFMPLYFLTGVVFPVHKVPQEYLDWLLWNPMLHLVELSRHSFIAQYQPVEGVNLLYPLGFTLLVSTWGLALYRVKRLQLITVT
jgi:capsular polysaccharide transport system permease protein